MKMYISGPMSGQHDFNRATFRAAEATLREYGFDDIINPADIEGDDWGMCMRQAIKKLVDADGVTLLPGWDKSTGACIEAQIAQWLNIPRFYFDPSCFSREEAARILAVLS